MDSFKKITCALMVALCGTVVMNSTVMAKQSSGQSCLKEDAQMTKGWTSSRSVMSGISARSDMKMSLLGGKKRETVPSSKSIVTLGMSSLTSHQAKETSPKSQAIASTFFEKRKWHEGYRTLNAPECLLRKVLLGCEEHSILQQSSGCRREIPQNEASLQEIFRWQAFLELQRSIERPLFSSAHGATQ